MSPAPDGVGRKDGPDVTCENPSMFDAQILGPAIGSAFRKLDPRTLARNPVMFVVGVVTVLTTVLFLRDVVTGGKNLGFSFQINLALVHHPLRELRRSRRRGPCKAQADSLRRTRTETQAKRLTGAGRDAYEIVPGTSLKVGDVVLVEAGEIIPSDGEVIEGIASVNEAAITGESAPSSANPAATARR